jgi:class 3 adenylate cyclase
MNGAFENLIAPVFRYEGTLARLMGDAIFAFFGAPIGHEDDPRQRRSRASFRAPARRRCRASVGCAGRPPLAVRVLIGSTTTIVTSLRFFASRMNGHRCRFVVSVFAPHRTMQREDGRRPVGRDDVSNLRSDRVQGFVPRAALEVARPLGAGATQW